MIPNSTLVRHLKRPGIKIKAGPNTALHDDEESEIVKWMTHSIEKGAPPGSLEVLQTANEILKRRLGADSPTLGRGWLQRFNKRHQISNRDPENLEKPSTDITYLNVGGCCYQISPYIAERPEAKHEPVLWSNIKDMKAVNTNKKKTEMEKKARQKDQAEKKKIILNQKIQKAIQKIRKDEKILRQLMEQKSQL